ncbi:sugar efflux transporter [Deinococcus sp. S9]|uniref:sugar efflux transporter n=1 Tax=Deinococcus sp. S9 TaxID=2545754 RepID=UPI00105665CD|nr:sugar efflux transporter [Deinococcus sp. S9]TDE86680.1 MFS transporter [Deinococcus sp. S9]
MSEALVPSGGLAAVWRLPHAARLALAVLLLGFALSLASPYMALFGVNRAHMTPLQLGIFLSVNAISSVLISTRLARWSDRLPDRKPLVLVTLGAAALGYGLLSVLRGYPALLITGAVLLGTGAAAFPQLFSFARAQFAGTGGSLPDRAVTLLRSVFSLAWVVGPGLGAWALAALDFRGLFLLAASGFALAGLLVWWVPPAAASLVPTPPHPQVGEGHPQRPLAWVAFAFVLYGMSMSMGMTMFPLLITKVLHGTDAQVGFLVGLCALLEIPVMLAFVVVRRLPATERLVKYALALFVLHFALLYLAAGMPLLTLTQGVRAVVIAVMAGLGMAYFQELMPGRLAAATTLFANTTNIGAMLAGIVSGACAQLFGYRAVFLLCGLLTLGAWLVMAVVTRRRPANRTKEAARRA